MKTHTIEEAKYALRFNEALIGINNRNLKTLKTDINTTYNINNVLQNFAGPLICESGIKTKKELLEIEKKTRIKTFLIGESLLKNLNKKLNFYSFSSRITPYFIGFLIYCSFKRTFVEQ